jgi:hypothetical protein
MRGESARSGRGFVKAGVFGVGALSLCCVLSLAAPSHAQAPAPPPPAIPANPVPQPVTGFVPPYEIMRTVRAAGFDPLAPPLREGTTYVLRATDFRGILMRVVVDARTGTIRDVTQIVPGPGRYGQIEPDVLAPPYNPADYDVPLTTAPGADIAPPMLRSPRAFERPAALGPLPLPPLPRPRPAALVSRKPVDYGNPANTGLLPANPNGAAGAGDSAAASTVGGGPSATPPLNANTAAPAAPSAAKKPAAVLPFND